jgi:hypothetical protein
MFLATQNQCAQEISFVAQMKYLGYILLTMYPIHQT